MRKLSEGAANVCRSGVLKQKLSRLTKVFRLVYIDMFKGNDDKSENIRARSNSDVRCTTQCDQEV